MYAWSTGNFDNDYASDWLEELCQSQDLPSIILALESVVELAGSEELEMTDCCCALAAAEIVAAANQCPGELPKAAKTFIREQGLAVADPILLLARRAVDAVRTGSPLLAHWKKEGALDEWLSVIDDLDSRLKARAATS